MYKQRNQSLKFINPINKRGLICKADRPMHSNFQGRDYDENSIHRASACARSATCPITWKCQKEEAHARTSRTFCPGIPGSLFAFPFCLPPPLLITSNGRRRARNTPFLISTEYCLCYMQVCRNCYYDLGLQAENRQKLLNMRKAERSDWGRSIYELFNRGKVNELFPQRLNIWVK